MKNTQFSQKSDSYKIKKAAIYYCCPFCGEYGIRTRDLYTASVAR